MIALAPWDSTGRVFYSRFHSRFAPGFTPGSLPVLLPVRSRFYSRFAPGFTPDSRYNSISLNHSRGSRKRWYGQRIALSITLYHHPSHFL